MLSILQEIFYNLPTCILYNNIHILNSLYECV